jgi:hypothetical protein
MLFWVVTPCGLVGINQRFRETYHLHLQHHNPEEEHRYLQLHEDLKSHNSSSIYTLFWFYFWLIGYLIVMNQSLMLYRVGHEDVTVFRRLLCEIRCILVHHPVYYNSGQVISTPALYSGGPGFILGLRLVILTEVFVVFHDLIMRRHFLPCPFQFIIH